MPVATAPARLRNCGNISTAIDPNGEKATRSRRKLLRIKLSDFARGQEMPEAWQKEAGGRARNERTPPDTVGEIRTPERVQEAY